MRSDAWRYTEWRTWNRAKLSPTSWDAAPYARELYAHAGDDGSNYSKFENVNVAGQAGNAGVVAELSAALRARFETDCVAHTA